MPRISSSGHYQEHYREISPSYRSDQEKFRSIYQKIEQNYRPPKTPLRPNYLKQLAAIEDRGGFSKDLAEHIEEIQEILPSLGKGPHFERIEKSLIWMAFYENKFKGFKEEWQKQDFCERIGKLKQGEYRLCSRAFRDGTDHHRLVLEFQRLRNGSFQVFVYNSGNCLGFHQKKGNKYQTMNQYFLSEEQLQSAFSLHNLKDFYQYIQPFRKAMKDAPYQSVQKGDNCILESPMAFLKSMLKDEDYKFLRASQMYAALQSSTEKGLKEKFQSKLMCNIEKVVRLKTRISSEKNFGKHLDFDYR